jgi:hypothetical protein
LRGTLSHSLARTFIFLAPALALAGISLAAPGAAGAATLSVHWDSQASTDPFGSTVPAGDAGDPIQPNTEIEPSIAVNPGDPNDVVTVFQEGRVDGGGDADNGFASTLNGLSSSPTWTFGNLPGVTKAVPNAATTPCLTDTPPTTAPFDRASDAVVTFGYDPTGQAHGGYIAYANSLVFDDNTCGALPSGMAMNQSSDGGKTWTPALILESDHENGLNDKNWIIADNRPGALHRGRLYNFWDKTEVGLTYTYCDPNPLVIGGGCDKATNWTTFAQETSGSQATLPPAIGVFPVVLKDGSLGMVFNDRESAAPCLGTNPTDNACLTAAVDLAWTIIPGADDVPFPSPLPVADQFVDITPYDSHGVTLQRAGSLPQAAVDPNTNEVYITWEDNRFRPANQKNQNDAVIMYAQDPGTGLPGMSPSSWSGPIQVNPPDNNFIDHYNPTIAIGADSILRVAYRQRPEPNGAVLSGPGYPIDTYYQEAPTGTTTSASFSAPLKADTTQNTNDPQFGAFSRGGIFEGDYEQIAAVGTDQSYVVRDEAWPGSASACQTGFSTTQTCQNQQTFVALIEPASSNPDVPDIRFVPALVLVGGAVGLLVLRRRRLGGQPGGA